MKRTDRIEKLWREIEAYDEYFRSECIRTMDTSHLDNPSVYKFVRMIEIISLMKEGTNT